LHCEWRRFFLAADVRERLVPSEGDALDGALTLARRSEEKIHNETVRQ